MLPIRARVDLGAVAIKEYSAFPKAPRLLESHHQIVLCHIHGNRLGSLTFLQRCSQCILQTQPTGPVKQRVWLHTYLHTYKIIFKAKRIMIFLFLISFKVSKYYQILEKIFLILLVCSNSSDISYYKLYC